MLLVSFGLLIESFALIIIIFLWHSSSITAVQSRHSTSDGLKLFDLKFPTAFKRFQIDGLVASNEFASSLWPCRWGLPLVLKSPLFKRTNLFSYVEIDR